LSLRLGQHVGFVGSRWIGGRAGFDLTHGGLDGGASCGRRGEGQCGLVVIEGELAVLEMLVGDDGGIECGGGMVRLQFERVLKRLVGFGIAATLMLDQAESVPCLGESSIELQRLTEAMIGRVDVPGAQLSGSEFYPGGFEAGQGGEGRGEFVDGGIQIPLFEGEAAQVEAGGEEGRVERDGLLVGLGGIVEATGLMIGQTEETPGAGLLGEQALGVFEALDGPGWLTFGEEAFAIEEGARSGRGTADEPNGGADGQKSESTSGDPVFGGQH
jgi:hypothetical protein